MRLVYVILGWCLLVSPLVAAFTGLFIRQGKDERAT